MKKVIPLLAIVSVLFVFSSFSADSLYPRSFVAHVHVDNGVQEQMIVWLVYAKDHKEAKKIFNHCVKKKYPNYNWHLGTYMVYEATDKEYYTVSDLK